VERTPSESLPVVAGTSAATTEAIFFGNHIAGSYLVPASGITEITWYASVDGTNYYPAYDWANGIPVAIVQTVVASKIVGMPPALAGMTFLKAVATAGAGGTIYVRLKA
jgi:hypothetical protein